MAKPDTEREKELIEAFEIVLSYVQRVYGVEFDRPIGFIVRRLLDYVGAEPIEVGENRLPGQDVPKGSTYKCGLGRGEIYGAEYNWRDEAGRLHVVCGRFLRALREAGERNEKADSIKFK